MADDLQFSNQFLSALTLFHFAEIYEDSPEYLSIQHAETSNPVYCTSGKATISQDANSDQYETPVDAASTECTLYESNVDKNVYFEPQTAFQQFKPDSELTYDYAIPD